jgi:hypothetical protein
MQTCSVNISDDNGIEALSLCKAYKSLSEAIHNYGSGESPFVVFLTENLTVEQVCVLKILASNKGLQVNAFNKIEDLNSFVAGFDRVDSTLPDEN